MVRYTLSSPALTLLSVSAPSWSNGAKVARATHNESKGSRMPSAQNRARALAIAQDFGAEALELNRQLVAGDPADVASRTRLARCHLQAGQLDEAEAEYREVLRLDAKNRIAAGGLEAIEQKRHQGDLIQQARSPRPARADRERAPRAVVHRASGSATLGMPAGPVPAVFAGFERRDFTELQLAPRGELHARFAPRVVDLVRRVNALQSSAEIAAIREPGRRQLFRLSRAEVHATSGHWFVYNAGARWEAQFNIGMYGGTQRAGDWLRIGLAFDLSDRGNDADPGGPSRARAAFRQFQQVLQSPRRSLFLGWMIKENGRVEYNKPGPRLDLPEASDAADMLARANADATQWVFLGKWLSPEDPDEAALLADPVSLVRTIDRAFAGLLPLWRAIRGD